MRTPCSRTLTQSWPYLQWFFQCLLLPCKPLLAEENEPAHEIMAFFVLRKLILQTRMRNYPVGLDV